MINFLPEKLKKQVKKEYIMRVFSIFFILISLTFLFILVFLTPAYTLSLYRKGVISEQLDLIKGSSVNQGEDSLIEVKKINEIVRNLSLNTDLTKPASFFIKSLLDVKSNEVRISSFYVEFDLSIPSKISIKGISATRDALTEYVKNIKNLNLFSNVDLPVSSLVKSEDIEYTIVLFLKK